MCELLWTHLLVAVYYLWYNSSTEHACVLEEQKQMPEGHYSGIFA